MKSLAKNSFYNVMYKVLNVFFPLVTSMYVSRVLLAEGVGRVASAQNIVTYFILIAALGLPSYGVKKIAECKSSDETNKTFSELYMINFISTITSSLFYYSLVFYSNIFNDKIIFYIVGLQVISNLFNVDWFYQGKEEYKYIAIRSFVVKLILLMSVFVFIKTRDDYIKYALIQTMGAVLNYCFNMVHLRKYVHFSFLKTNIRQHLKPVFVLLAASIAIEVYTLADTTMLTFLCGEMVVGYYATSLKCINMGKTLVTAISAVYLPRMSYYFSLGDEINFYYLIKKGITILLSLSIPIMIIMCFYATDFVPLLFGKSFTESIASIQILSVSIISISLSSFIGYQILIILGKEKLMFYSTVIGACINIILNTFLIPRFQHNGAALASVVAEFCVTFYQYKVLKKNSDLKISLELLKSVIYPAILMIIVSIVVVLSFTSGCTRLIIGIFLSAIVYIIASYYYRNELLIGIISRVTLIKKRKN